MANIFDMMQEQKAELAKADALIGEVGHEMTASEKESYNGAMRRYDALRTQVEARKAQNTIRTAWPNGMPTTDGAPQSSGFMAPFSPALNREDTQSPEYKNALRGYLASGGKVPQVELALGADGHGGFVIPGSESFTRQRRPNGSYNAPRANAAAYEGTGGSSDAAGGYTVSVPTIQQIVPLGMPDLGIFDASMVLPTATDVKIPQQASFGTSAIKAESTGTIATFGGNDPSFGQITLSAYMVGAVRIASFELLQDVSMFQQFLVDDLLRAQRILEGQLFATGTGSAQPTGVFGNTGLGVNAAYELTGAATDGQILLNALFDVTATLKGDYQAGASWVMSRATGLAIKRAQMQANLYVPICTQDADGTERILGKPVYYDVNAPALPTATTAGVVPILYGDIQQGNIIGVRGGAGINVKLLDQPLALQGQIAILAYRRVDSKIRMAEAIQQIKVSHS
jgi:HK97 family phage major capsid protein